MDDSPWYAFICQKPKLLNKVGNASLVEGQ